MNFISTRDIIPGYSVDLCLSGGRLFGFWGFGLCRGQRFSGRFRLRCFRFSRLFDFLARRENSVQRSAFHTRMKFYNSALAYVLNQAVDDLVTQLAMSHLPAAKTQGGFHLVAFMQKTHSLIFLGLVIVLIDRHGELHFFDDDHFLFLTRGSLALIFLVEKLAIVLDAANRGNSVRRNLHQVQPALPGNLQRFKRGENSKLLAVLINNANFTRADPIVDTYKLLRRTLVDVPPPEFADCAAS